jgi:hypothetical protein
MQNWNKEPRHKTAALSENQEDTTWVRQEGLRTRICEASKQDVQWVVEGERLDLMERSAPSGERNQGLDTVEGSAPSTTDEESICVFSIRAAGNVGARATRDSSTPTM